MSSYDSISLERDGAVAVITLDRPKKLNAMDVSLLRELLDATTKVNDDEAIRVVILTGRGSSFCAGADLKMTRTPGQTVQDHLNQDHLPVLMAIRNATKPWISAVNGAAAGVGSAYAMNCDLTVMADDAYLYQAFAAIGLVPDGGATWHLANTIGRKRAYELIATGEKLPADRCLALGLCNRVVESDHLVEETMRWAQELSQRAPLSLRHAKAAIWAATENDFATTFQNETELQMVCSASEDSVEGVQAFMQRRPPQFKGR